MSGGWQNTQFVGVRFREHPSRKVNGKPDRYFTIRYKLEGRLKEEVWDGLPRDGMPRKPLSRGAN